MTDLKMFHGTGVALVTPFKKDGSIDFEGLKNLLIATATKGVDYYVVNGTTGESTSTSDQEKADILQFVKENNPLSLPIVYGLGGNNTLEIINKLDKTDLNCVDAILSVSPAYNKPSQEGIIKHFELIADKSQVPIILYNVPGRTSSNLIADTTLHLANHSNIIGIKEASGSIEQAMHIMSKKPKDFVLISGDDLLTVSLYALGAVGVISVLANAFGDHFKTIKEKKQTNDYLGASEELFKLLRINELMFKESNPVGIKYVLKAQGVCNAYVRLPLLEASPSLKTAIETEMKSIY